jgi:hypothetical protein
MTTLRLPPCTLHALQDQHARLGSKGAPGENRPARSRWQQGEHWYVRGEKRIRLRISQGRSIVGIDKFTVEPLHPRMRISERFLEIAHPLALLHYGRIIGHKPGYHPVRATPSQNHFPFRNRLRLHAGLVPKLTERWTDRRDRANGYFRKKLGGWPLPTDWPSRLPGCPLRPALFPYGSGIDRHRRERHRLSASEREAAELIQVRFMR